MIDLIPSLNLICLHIPKHIASGLSVPQEIPPSYSPSTVQFVCGYIKYMVAHNNRIVLPTCVKETCKREIEEENRG